MKKIAKYLIITIGCCAVFYFLGEPFRSYLKLSETTEVRPVAVLPVLFAMSFGFAGTLGCAFGNLLADIFSGYPPAAFVPGFFIQLIYGYIPVIIWNHLRKNEENKFRFDRVYKILQYLLIMLADSVLVALMVWGLISAVYKTPLFGLGFFNTFFNEMIFFIVLGIPYLSLSSVLFQISRQRKKNLKTLILFSLNEKFILFFLVTAILISVIMGVNAYFIFKDKNLDNMAFWSYIYFVVGIMLFILLSAAIAFLSYMERSITRPLEGMSDAAKNFGHDIDINHEIEMILAKCHKYLYFTTEIGSLARSYSAMANELGEYVKNLTKISAEKKKNETQLKIATEIQLGALPKPIELETVDIYASMTPALEVGGDFYDFFKLDENHIALFIADVSGKGIPAAMFMMTAKIILRQNLKNHLSPAKALEETNYELCRENPAEMFVTCFCAILDTKTNVLTCANAGHEKPAVCRKNGNFSFDDTKGGFILGCSEKSKYKDFQIGLYPGDIVFMCTDGIPESMTAQEEQFGNDRLISVLNGSKDKSLSEICSGVKKAVSDFSGNLPQFDDITVLIFKIKEK